MRDCSWILAQPGEFQNVRPDNFVCSSDRTNHLPCGGYNCIAWAAGKTDQWWWPINDPCAFWPIPLDPVEPESLEQFIKAFESEGYTVCKNAKFQNGFEKVAIYVDDLGDPTHAARSLPSGMWTSKMGNAEDIEHTDPTVVEGKKYGKAKAYLRRKNPLCQKANHPMKFLSRLLEYLRWLLRKFSPRRK
jgi:hypothetical protein